MAITYGSKRLSVGAHYGLRDWLAQRVTALVMALFTFIVLGRLIFSRGPIGCDTWAGLFELTLGVLRGGAGLFQLTLGVLRGGAGLFQPL